MHAMMSAALGGAPVVMHDIASMSAGTDEERDKKFWLEAMRSVTR
jgi:hypothetical protein